MAKDLMTFLLITVLFIASAAISGCSATATPDSQGVQGLYDVVDTGTSLLITGDGPGISRDFSLPDNYYIVKQTYEGAESDTLLWRLINKSDQTEVTYNLFYGGSTDQTLFSYNPRTDGQDAHSTPYYLLINANGNWTIEFVKPVNLSTAVELPYTLKGQGRMVLPLIRWGEGNVTVDVAYDGKEKTSFYVKFVPDNPAYPGYFYPFNGFYGLDNEYYANGVSSYTVPYAARAEIDNQLFDYVYLFVRTGDPASNWQITLTGDSRQSDR